MTVSAVNYRNMNVLVYNGPGASPDSVKHAVETLRHFLEPYYAVSVVSQRVLQTEPWATKTSAVVFPGGADLPYIKECSKIFPLLKKFVSQQGGIFIGFCAGGYFGSGRVEFAQGDPILEVTGNRELKFFPGIARGPAFRGFQYNSESGARAAKLTTNNNEKLSTYFNGGGVFVDAQNLENVEVLATYDEPLDVSSTSMDSSVDGAAIVLCRVGKGTALLTGPHPEFIPRLLKKSIDTQYNSSVVDVLEHDEIKRLKFMKYILSKAGLRCNNDILEARKPSLTPLLVFAPNRQHLIEELVSGLTAESTLDSHQLNFESNKDKFRIYRGFAQYKNADDFLLEQDQDEVIKSIVLPSVSEDLPPPQLTPNFNVTEYFKYLNPNNSLGSMLMYGEVVTSTSALLDSNKTLLAKFPENTLLHIGRIQISGRGRGGNVWVNPKGVSASTACVNLPLQSPRTGKPVSIVFVQYLAMLAYCKAIVSYAPGYEDLPVRIKWPNDLYALKPEYYNKNNMKLLNNAVDHNLVPLNDIEPAYVKISGLLVNTNFLNGKYSLLLGCGLNVNNDAPTTSLKAWVDILNKEREQAGLEILPPVEIEKLQALYMNNLDVFLKNFIDYGATVILPQYYRYWLHTGQIVTLVDHFNARAKITGITDDYGLLIAKELVPGSDSQFTGTIYHLQPDGNTFDIFRGLISKKAV